MVWKILLVILIVLVVALIVLYILGRRLQKKQAAQEEQMEAAKQSVSMLVIDKKMLPLKESGLPQIVIDQTPRLMRRQKMPIVKAKVGPRIMTLVADAKIFDQIPVKKEVRAVVSGIYIMDVKGIRGPLEAKPVKKRFWQRLRDRAMNTVNRQKADTKNSKATTKSGSKGSSGKSVSANKSSKSSKK